MPILKILTIKFREQTLFMVQKHGYKLKRIMYWKTYDNFQRLSPQNRISGAVMQILIQSKTMNCNQTLQLRVHTSRLESIKSFIYSIVKRIKTDTYNHFLFTPVLFSSHKGRENNKIYDTYLYQLCLPHKIEKTLIIRQK